jgi:hypothetical protein
MLARLHMPAKLGTAPQVQGPGKGSRETRLQGSFMEQVQMTSHAVEVGRHIRKFDKRLHFT